MSHTKVPKQLDKWGHLLIAFACCDACCNAVEFGLKTKSKVQMLGTHSSEKVS